MLVLMRSGRGRGESTEESWRRERSAELLCLLSEREMMERLYSVTPGSDVTRKSVQRSDPAMGGSGMTVREGLALIAEILNCLSHRS
jgi:hypothetical protein